jgi:ferritin-like metal-binding protein YciE
MPAVKISGPRDLAVQLLGELLYVERRLHDALLPALVASVCDEELRDALREHQQQTRAHVERAEQAFSLLGVRPTSNLFQPLEAAASQHEEGASSIVDTTLADLFHAQSALHTEHMELAAYRTLLPLVPKEVGDLLMDSYDEEGDAAKLLVKTIDRLAEASSAS